MIRHSARTCPAHPAVVMGERTLTYAELHDRARRLAGALRAHGLAPGDRFALLCANRLEIPEVYFAAAIAGLVCVPLNHRLTAVEITDILEDAGARLLIADPRFEEVVTAIADGGFDGRIVRFGSGQEGEYDRLLEGAGPMSASPEGGDSGVVMQMYTSGTTGVPKGVMLSHGNISANGWSLLAEGSVTSADRYLNSAPLTHLGAGSRVFLLAHVGATHVIHDGFDPEALVGALDSGEANATLVVPSMLRQLLDAARERGASLKGKVRMITYGTAPMPTPLLREAMESLGCGFQQGYGLTEASPNLTLLSVEDHLPDQNGGYAPQLMSVGRETIGTHVRVVDENDEDVAPGEVGEIIARGANIMQGYWGRPEETSAALRGGWLRTGDLASVDDLGYVYLSDRKKDMLVSGGFNVYPREIERQLELHPAVAAAAVVGRPDERWGEVPVAFVVATQDAPDPSSLSAELRDLCVQRLAKYKHPKDFQLIDELPVTSLGKVSKVALRQLLTHPGTNHHVAGAHISHGRHSQANPTPS
jgi:fatty-acyl-CoA synthase